jgi:hypothetical protein
MLKKTGVELELITDYNMMQYFEKGIRGGVSTVLGDRHVKIDDPKKERLMYLDANNLYGWAMNQKLPTGNFEWIDKEEEIEKLEDSIKNDKINGEEDIGYCMRVDLIVPKTEKYINYPLAPENKNIEYDDLSEYSKSLLPDEKSPESEKLILDFTDKKDYIIHIKNLIEYYKLGAKFTIKDAIKFEQSPWLKPYIDFNTEKRSNANNEFEKDFYKLANNSVFGKTMENVRNYQEIHLCNSWKNAKYFIKKPNFNNFTIFDKNLVAIHMDKTKITFNKPIYVGFAILEISKTLMYDFYYNKLEKIFNNVKAVYTDTDSFVIYIKDDNITKKLKENNEYFDFSNYPKEHILYSEKNNKVVGKFKDELGGNIIREFAVLRSKMYGYNIFEDPTNHIRAKGIKASALIDTAIEDFKKCLYKNVYKDYEFRNIVHKKHEIYTETLFKRGLNPFDDKRFYINNIKSLPHLDGKITKEEIYKLVKHAMTK